MMNDNEKEIIAKTLDERYNIYTIFGERNEDWLYYAGMLGLIERLGISWERKDDGKHIIY